MTFEERMDRLTERHEALTQTVEHMALQGEEQNKRLLVMGDRIERLVGVTEQLAQIAQIHERRISGLEGVGG